MILQRQVRCPYCEKQTDLALVILQSKDVTQFDQYANCKHCDERYIFRTIITANVSKMK